MKVTKIIVSAGRTVSHPLESYANLRPQVTLKATVEDGEDYAQAVQFLQAKAEGLVEDHKTALIQNLIDMDHMKQKEREIARLEKGIRDSQTRLEDLRNDHNAAVPALVEAEPTYDRNSDF